MDKVRVFMLGFEDRSAKDGEIKSNGCVLQVHMQAEGELAIDLFAQSSAIEFEKVKCPQSLPTRVAGSGLDGI